MRGLLALCGVLALAAPADAQTLTCRTGAQSMAVAEILFGRNVGDRVGVSRAAFARFRDREITPRFPDGLTVVDAAGQWRDGGRLIREPSKMVIIALTDAARDQDRIAEIVAAYKKQFRQKSVLVVVRPTCISFFAD